jgi:tetratricopeptide (TPR) repeat protein
MRLTGRGKRRLLIVLAIAAVPMLGGVAFVGMRDVYRSRLVIQSRQNGLEAYRSGDYQKAMSELGYALSRNPDDAECLLAIADSRSRVFDVNSRHLIAAARIYHAVLKIDQSNLEALNRLLELYKRLGYRAEMIGIADRILAVAPDHSQAWAIKATAALHARRFNEAASIAERIGAIYPQDMLWRGLQIRALMAGGADEDAVLDLCDQWINAFEEDRSFRLLKAQILCDYGQIELARVELTHAAENGVLTHDALQSMVSLMDQLDMRDQADALIARGKSEFSGEPWVYEAGIRRQWQAARPERAMAELVEAVRRIGENQLELVQWRALLCIALGKPQEANEAIDRLLKLAESSLPSDRERTRAWAHAVRARLDADRLGWMKVTDIYERALSLDAENAVLQYLLAEAYQRMGEHEMAMLILKRTAAKDPHWSAVQIARAESLLATGKPREAFQTIAAAIRKAPDLGASSYLLLARAWSELGADGENLRLVDSRTQNKLDMLNLLESVHEQLGWHAIATPLLAHALMQHGAVQEAKALMERAMIDQAVDPEVYVALVEVSQQWKLGLDQQLLDQAGLRGGFTPALAVAQSEIWRDQGETDKALAVLDQALATTGLTPESAAHLQWRRAAIQLQSGRHEGQTEIAQVISRSTAPAALMDLLNIETVWEHETVVKQTLERMKQLVGNRSPRLLLAEARYLHRFRSGDPASMAEALKIVRGILDVAPDSKEALLLMASLQIAGDDPQPQEAIRYLKRAIDADPNDAKVYPRLIRLLQDQGHFDAARQYVAQLSEHTADDAGLLRTAAEFQEHEGDFEPAINTLKRVPEAERTEADWRRLAWLHQRSGDGASAAAIFRRLLESAAPSEHALAEAAEFYGSSGRDSEGLTLFETALADRAETIQALGQGRLYFAAGSLEQANRFLSRAFELDPTNVAAWSELAKLHVASGEIEKARAAAQQAIRRDPENAALKVMLAIVDCPLNEAHRQQLLAGAKEIDQRHPALDTIIRLYAAVADPGETELTEARQLVRDHPRSMVTWRLAVVLHARARRWDEALQLAKRALSWFPADPAPAEMATRLLIQIGRTDEALATARTWRRLSLIDPLDADTVTAALLLDLDRAQDAFELLGPASDRILAQREQSPGRLEIWLACLVRQGRVDEAIAIINPLLDQGDRWGLACLRIAQKLGQAEAETIIAVVEQRLSKSAQGRLHMAMAWHELARRFSASSAYTRANEFARPLLDDPSVGDDALLVCAGIASELDDLDAAEALYRRGLDRNSQSILILNNLADVLLRQRTKCAEAVMLAQRGAELAGGGPNVLDTLAQALLCSGDHAQAESRLQTALAVQPQNASFLVTLALIRHAQGRQIEARRELENARRALASTAIADVHLQRRIKELVGLLEGDAQIPRESQTAKPESQASLVRQGS